MSRFIVLIIVEIIILQCMWTPVKTEPFSYPCVTPDPFPVVVRGVSGELFNFTKVGYTTNGTYAMAYVDVPPSKGPTPHIHYRLDEWFYFPEGGIHIFSSNATYPDLLHPPSSGSPRAPMYRYYTQPGDLIYSSRFHVHGYQNNDNITRPMISVWAPDIISNFFFQTGLITTDGSKVPLIDNQNLSFVIATAQTYGMSVSTTMDEYVETWHDDWQPVVGWDANASELIKLLTGLSVNTSDSYPTICSHAMTLSNYHFHLSMIYCSMLSFIFWSKALF